MKTRKFPLFVTLLLMVCGLTVLGIMGYLFMNRLRELNQQVAGLSQQVEGAIKELQVVAEKAEASSSQASRAEERALEAARGRVQAETEQAAAKKTAEQAGEEAQRAKQDAKLAQEEAQLAREEASFAQQEARLAQQEARLAQQEAELAQQEAERIRREREDEMNRLQTALSQIGETRRTALGLVMTLGSDSMQFEFDKAILRAENRELLSKIIGILLTSKDYGIYVYGHTDNIGSEEYNLELSKKRAQNVRDYLAENGIAPEIITTEGFGKSRPLVPESSEMARAKNRRVEIGIVDTVINYQRSIAPGEE